MRTPIDIAGRVRQVLSTRGLTLYQVSRESTRVFGHRSPYHVPEHFYSALATSNAGPTIHQFVALSRISGYRLSDWLLLFGFSLDDISRLQILFTRPRTILLDASVYDEDQWIPWLKGRTRTSALPAIAPLAQVFEPAPPRRARDVLSLNTQRFLYAKIGREDILAFPDLIPGSIARIDPSIPTQFHSALAQVSSSRIFLVETASRLTCGRLRRIRGNRVALCSTSFSYPPLEVTLGHDARILGVVDAEVRPVGTGRLSRVPAQTPARASAPPGPLQDPAKLGQLIRMSRTRQGLSFRDASAMSRSVASALDDQTYFASPGTLADYERLSRPPRHIQKILSLCILYGIGFRDFLRAGEITLDSLGSDPVPDELCGRTAPHGFRGSEKTHTNEIGTPDFLSVLIDQWKEIPLFLRRSLSEITRLPHLSLLDFFSVAPEQDVADSRLSNAALVAVNRRLKRPLGSPPPALRDEPVYMLVARDGGYLCAPCTFDRGALALHRQPSTPLAPVETETRTDLEVIGQVTAILRRLT